MKARRPVPAKARPRRELRRKASLTRRLRLWRVVGWLFSVLFVLGGLAFGSLFALARPAESQLALGSENRDTINAAINNVGQAFDLPFRIVPAGTQAPDWKSSERINILLLGVDQRVDNLDDPGRSDSMIIATVDPVHRTASMLSVPRDLYVTIPGYGQQKINSAYTFGEYNRLPGGGPALAKQVVQQALGIRVHYYVLVNFDGFRKVIDTLGGIDVYVDYTIIDPEYPTEDYGYKYLYIAQGWHHFTGDEALEYARTRHGDDDIGRSKRQQKVILAARQRAEELDLLPKLPQLLNDLKDVFRTDLAISEILQLAKLGELIPLDNIRTVTFDDSTATAATTRDGAWVFLPRQTNIQRLVDDLFYDPRDRNSATRIEIINASGIPGAGVEMQSYLKTLGYTNVKVSPSLSAAPQPISRLADYGRQSATAKILARLMRLAPSQVNTRFDAATNADVRLVLGQDLVQPAKPEKPVLGSQGVTYPLH